MTQRERIANARRLGRVRHLSRFVLYLSICLLRWLIE